MLIVIESIVMCFVLLFVCVIGIANGAVGLVIFYEDDVRDRVVELGLTTKQKIRNNKIAASIAMFVPMIFGVPTMVYYVNGARNFFEVFWQIALILWIMGIFDRIFIDWYWVGHTKAWFIAGTEDLMPYISKKTSIRKWTITIFVYPIFAAIMAGITILLHDI